MTGRFKLNYLLQYSLTATCMSYFQKGQRPLIEMDNNRQTKQLTPNNISTAQFRKNADSRQSYLKAFKKYYIDKLINQKSSSPCRNTAEKQNRFPMPSQTSPHKKLQKDQGRESSKLNRSKMVALVNNNENQIEEVLYNSLSQLEREMLGASSGNDLARQNKILRGSIQKLKVILKQKLEVALKKNKEELTMMFDEYSSMIRKLLDDKQSLTNRLERMRLKEEESLQNMEAEYENKIRIIVEDNNAQITSTKNQIEEFLDIIVQYEEQAAQEKQEVEKMREKVVELQMQNDQLQQERENTLNHTQRGNGDTAHYAIKIQNLLSMIEKLQEENGQLNQFLKSCKCSRIKSKTNSNQSLSQQTSEDLVQRYEKQLVESQKQLIREQMAFRQALRRKDQCIERLELVIDQMRRSRYESVDRITQQTLARQSK